VRCSTNDELRVVKSVACDYSSRARLCTLANLLHNIVSHDGIHASQKVEKILTLLKGGKNIDNETISSKEVELRRGILYQSNDAGGKTATSENLGVLSWV
jgi:hypothetical protein